MVSLSPETLKQKLADGDDAEDQMKKVYRHFVESPHARKQYRHFFDLVLENAEAGATLFHCTAGKDRTGFGAFLLLSLLEVDQSTIKQDYLATNRYLGPFLKESFLDESLAAIKKEFGTVDQYLKEGLAITKDEKEYFHAHFTE